MSNANHTGRQCTANPAISKLLSHSFISPHRLHCGREHRDTKKSTRKCYNCNCKSNVSHHRCQYSALHNSEQFLYERKAWGSDYESVSCDYTAGLLNSRVTEGFNRSELMCAAASLIALFDFLSVCCLKCAGTLLCKLHFYIRLICWVESWQCSR